MIHDDSQLDEIGLFLRTDLCNLSASAITKDSQLLMKVKRVNSRLYHRKLLRSNRLIITWREDSFIQNSAGRFTSDEKKSEKYERHAPAMSCKYKTFEKWLQDVRTAFGREVRPTWKQHAGECEKYQKVQTSHFYLRGSQRFAFRCICVHKNTLWHFVWWFRKVPIRATVPKGCAARCTGSSCLRNRRAHRQRLCNGREVLSPHTVALFVAASQAIE